MTEEEKIAQLQQKAKTDKPKKGKEASLDGAASKPPKRLAKGEDEAVKLGGGKKKKGKHTDHHTP